MPFFMQGQQVHLVGPEGGDNPDERGAPSGDAGSFEMQGSTTAELRLTELDQTFPAGRYRFIASGDQILLQRNGGASWPGFGSTPWGTATTIGTWTSGGGYLIPDDQLFRLGTDGDQVLVNRSTVLGANTALTGAVVGTPVTPAIAANSLVLSNVTASGDILVAANLAGNSQAWLWVDSSASIMTVYGAGVLAAVVAAGQVRFADGTEAAPSVSFNSDTDNGLYYAAANDWHLVVGGDTFLRATASIVVVNEDGTDRDFRIESDTNASAFTLDSGSFAGVGAFGIGRAINTVTFLLLGPPALTADANSNYYHMDISPLGSVTIPAGTAAIVAGLNVEEPDITATGTVTAGVTFRVGAAPTEGTNNYAMWIDSGTTRFDDSIGVGIGVGGVYAAQPTSSIGSAGGVMIGASSTNNLFDDASNGGASTTMFIGNGTIALVSDVRVKFNLEPYRGDALGLFRRLQVVEYDMLEANKPFGRVYDGRYVSLTAQALYEVVPWVVNTQGGRDCWECRAGLQCELHLPWQVKFDLMAGLFVKGFQEVSEWQESTSVRLERLERENEELRVRVAELEGR